MMENYFNVFKSTPIPFESRSAASIVSEPDRQELVEKLASGFQNPPGVTVAISSAAQEPAIVAPITKSPDGAVYEPKEGVMVKRDSANYLSGYQDMDKRISMVEVDDNGQKISSDSLASIMKNAESRAISLSSLVADSGGFNAAKSDLHARVELGNIRGGDFLFDVNGNIIGQKYVGMVETVQNENKVSLNLTTESGQDIRMDLVLADQMSQQGVKGVSRDLNFSYSVSGELNQQEVEGLSAMLAPLSGAFASFHDDWSLTQDEADGLIQSIADESDVFTSISAQLKMESGALSRVMSFTLADDGEVEVASKEKGMEVAYDVSTLSTDVLQMHFGDSRTNLDMLIKISETNNRALAYRDAIGSALPDSLVSYGEYIGSFFES